MSHSKAWRTLRSEPRAMLGAVMVVALVLALVPRRVVAPLSNVFNHALAPGRAVAVSFRDSCAATIARCEQATSAAAENTQLAADVQQLRARNRELELALLVAQYQAVENSATDAAGSPSLVLTHGVQARVLGRQACAVLPNDILIGLGARGGATREALVLTGAPVPIDQGQDRGLAAGDLALYGRRVYGKVIEVGPHTSVVRPVDQPGFRDVVQLARPAGKTLHFGPQGLWEGTGERTCRVRLVGAAEPAAVGDLVFTAGHEGLVPQPLLYGTVVRATLHAGAPHWEIEVEPAAADAVPRELTVLRATLNPARVATRTGMSATE